MAHCFSIPLRFIRNDSRFSNPPEIIISSLSSRATLGVEGYTDRTVSRFRCAPLEMTVAFLNHSRNENFAAVILSDVGAEGYTDFLFHPRASCLIPLTSYLIYHHMAKALAAQSWMRWGERAVVRQVRRAAAPSLLESLWPVASVRRGWWRKVAWRKAGCWRHSAR